MAVKFFRRGISKIYFLPAVASPSTGPTSGEITAGADLSSAVTGIANWTLSNTPIPSPVLSDRFEETIDGPDTVGGAPTITFDDLDDGSQAARTLLAKGIAGFIVLMPYGHVTAKRCEVWSVKSTGVNDEWDLGNVPARFNVAFTVPIAPVQTAVLP